MNGGAEAAVRLALTRAAGACTEFLMMADNFYVRIGLVLAGQLPPFQILRAFLLSRYTPPARTRGG